jgi:hypothetical protein
LGARDRFCFSQFSSMAVLVPALLLAIVAAAAADLQVLHECV